MYSNSNIVNVDSVHLYDGEAPVVKEIEFEKGRNYKGMISDIIHE